MIDSCSSEAEAEAEARIEEVEEVEEVSEEALTMVGRGEGSGGGETIEHRSGDGVRGEEGLGC